MLYEHKFEFLYIQRILNRKYLAAIDRTTILYLLLLKHE